MEDVVAHHHVLAFARVGHVVADFLRLIRIGEIHGAQAAGEPGDVEGVAVDLLGGLMGAEAAMTCRFSLERDDEGSDGKRYLIDRYDGLEILESQI